MRARLTTFIATAGLLCAGPPVFAQGPSFDCTKAQGEVQKLVCTDAGLAALDRKLDGIYKAAVAKAKGQMLSTLRAEQRGWVKGRDDCWKAQAQAPDFITATWQVGSPKECAEAQYKVRMAELQAVWQLLPPKTVSYACNDNPANEIVVNYFESELPSARIEHGDQTVTAYRTPTAGGKYEGQNVTFWSKGIEAGASWLNVNTGNTEELKCKAR